MQGFQTVQDLTAQVLSVCFIAMAMSLCTVLLQLDQEADVVSTH